MRIVLLTSWPLDVRLGSGVVRMLLGVQSGLRRLGHSADILHPQFESTSFLNLTNRRLQFNRYLQGQNLHSYDLIIGSDFDGYALNSEYTEHFYVLNGAILADIIPFESGRTQRVLKHLACRERQSMEKARKVFVPSRYTAGVVHNAYGIPQGKIKVVPLGINFEDWREKLRLAPALPKRGKEILCVAKQYARKGIGDLLQAFAWIRREVKDVHLTIVGDGPLYRQNVRLAKDLGIISEINFTGDISDRLEMAAFYKRADLFCLPSYHETFGLVFLEAMAAGLPVVAYYAAAVPEVLGNSVVSLIQPGNIEELARQLIVLLENRQLSGQLSKQGMQRAKSMPWLRSAQKLIMTVSKYHSL